jgi:hypothetical protein
MLDETAFTQSFMEGIKFLQSIFGRPSTHKPDDRHRRLLRARRERPSDRAAEQGDELAPSHSIT